MLRLKNHNGFSLIETMISLSIFSILFLSILKINLNSYRLRQSTLSRRENRIYLEGLKHTIFYNSDYSDIKYLQHKDVYYISKNYISISHLKELSITEMLSETQPMEKPYVSIKVTGDKVIKINLELHSIICGKEDIIKCEFFKGNY
jgi:prepilin-type N-terminal cleavage/methylation domain-containing protein